ncbi:class Ib ribonucleoside-diphosphate reductase assembly flavoprotein NrdI [Biostraticola tofi]|uniref:Protein NrdI n=1 Tax=Biostraticola tofi TaxID=466109 RepID=A0A4R3YLA9_9GAMM|nr:class Ib ribonucleoside-diphosphate reductase assembly flavoprotein NrdI [Biostraticola tofi]TCV93056.1 protein involved in ribonucleotide reduction [Biostraticola tofi]
MPALAYFSSSSENTHRFVSKLDQDARRIPIETTKSLEMDCPFILITPSYGGGNVRGSVPRQVILFLNNPVNRSLLRGVIGAGNRNFGTAFCLAGEIIANKCQVPYLYRFELLGTAEDVIQVRKGVTTFWQQQN